MNRPVICALGVCSRDIELATLWLRWVTFLSGQPGASLFYLLICVTREIARANLDKQLEDALGDKSARSFRAEIFVHPDEDEGKYPRSASHQFLRTMECSEARFPSSSVLWCEADSWPTKPSWFAEIAAEYQTCGKPFLGVTVGTKHRQMSGIGIYPHDWRQRAPKLANVLSAPDQPQWGVGKGMPWDVAARDQTYPQMAESKLMVNVWKNRDVRPTRLREVPDSCCIYHQDKVASLMREIAAARYPEFMSTITQPRRFFFMNGHSTRLLAKGLKISFSYSKFSAGFHRSAVCSDELNDEQASALATLVGQLGVREITEAEFLQLTGRIAKSLPAPRARAITPAPARETTHSSVFVMLGRYGDVVNILPMLKAEADAGRRPTLVIGKDFADILDGVSYCDRIVWDGAYEQLPEALRWLRRDKGIVSPVVCQYHRNPFDKSRLTDSYQKEVWRLAGRLDQFFIRGALEFDQRDLRREAELIERVFGDRVTKKNLPMVLVGLESVSSPLKNADEIMRAIKAKCSNTHLVVDLRSVKAERIYDLIGLFDAAALLVTADTVFGHLARASSSPVLALANSGWRGSVFSGEPVFVMRYENATTEVVAEQVERMLQGSVTLVGVGEKKAAGLDIDAMIEACKEIKRSRDIEASPPKVYHCVDVHGTSPRHDISRNSWQSAYAEGMIPAHYTGGPRDAKKELGDPRALPFLKDVLWSAIPEDATQCGSDIIVWTNGDIGFAPGTVEFIRQHVSTYHAATMRRTESNGKGHPGRDLFAFTIDWLNQHWNEIPDFVLGSPVFDLGIVAMIRKFHGLPALTMKNLAEDLHPADMTPGYALHQSHEPEWCVRNMNGVPSNKHNKRLFQEWAKRHCPEVRFSPAGNLK